jgi:hypothetical protein
MHQVHPSRVIPLTLADIIEEIGQGKECICNTLGVKHALALALHEHKHH